MHPVRASVVALLLAALAACTAQHVDRSGTLGSLHDVRPDTAEVSVEIEKNLPIQGGMGAGSANAAA